MIKRLLCILLSLVMLACVSAASGEESPAADEPAETAVEEAAAEAAEEPAEPVLLVTVNGEEIASDNDYLQRVISYYMDYAAEYGYDTSSPDMLAVINQYSLQYTIRSVLIRQKAAELGLDQFTDEENAEIDALLKDEWEGLLSDYIAQYGSLTDTSTDDDKAAARADAEAFFLSIGYDQARYFKEYGEAEKESRITTRLQDTLTADKTISEEDVLEYFDSLVKEDEESYASDISTYEFYTSYYGQSSYYTPEGYRGITHILLPVDEELLNTWKDLSARLEEQISSVDEEPTGDDEMDEEADARETPAPEADAESAEEPTPTPEPVTQEMVDAAEKAILDSVQPTVDEINAKLEAGASFDDLIKEYGTDPGMQDDATRAEGYYVHNDSILWDPVFTSAAMALEKVGDVSKPVVSQYGVHILQYLKDIPGGAVELTDEMKEEFRTTLLSEIRTEALNSALDQWEEEADIVYTEEGESWKAEEEEPDDYDDAAEESEEQEPVPEEAAVEEYAADEVLNP